MYNIAVTSIAIDTLKLTTKLKARGYTEQQAVGLAEALQDINLDQLVTRADLKAELAEFKAEIAEVKFELLKWIFGGFLGMSIMLAAVLLKLH